MSVNSLSAYSRHGEGHKNKKSNHYHDSGGAPGRVCQMNRSWHGHEALRATVTGLCPSRTKPTTPQHSGSRLF